MSNKTRETQVESTNLLTIPGLEQFLGKRRSWIYQQIKESGFPPPIKLGRSSRWRMSEVEGWLQQQPVGIDAEDGVHV